MKRPTPVFIGLFLLVSLYLFRAELVAMDSDLRVSTFKGAFTNQSLIGLPEDWSVKVWRGRPEIELVKERKGTVLKLRSHQSNVALYKQVDVDLARHPHLSWEWKVAEWPEHGDARHGERDDQAAGIYVMFPKFPAFLNSRIIGYVWESDVPQGTIVRSRNDSRIHYGVVRSGKQKAGEWVQEARNVEQDYEQIFGEQATTGGRSFPDD